MIELWLLVDWGIFFLGMIVTKGEDRVVGGLASIK